MPTTNKLVEIFSQKVRIVSHKIARYKGKYVTIKDSMPLNHT